MYYILPNADAIDLEFKQKGRHVKGHTMRTYFIALVSLVFALVPATAGPALSPFVSIDAGGAVTAETGYGAAVGAAYRARLGIAVGDEWGAVIQGGASYQSASAYTADWYRYRGFFGLDLGAGPRHDFGIIEAYFLAGGNLARYDNSYSYFWFPFLEAGASMPIASIGTLFRLDAGVSVPVQLRADAVSAGLRAVVTLAFLPPPSRASEDEQ